MAHKTYNDLWKETMSQVIHVLEDESKIHTNSDPASTSHTVLQRAYGMLYVRYFDTVSKLEDCYDQIAHPQKRAEVIIILEAVMGRMLEVYDFLVLLCGSEYVSLEDVLVDMKLTPSALTMVVPRYFKEERSKELEERDKLLTALLAQYNIKQEGSMEKSQESTLSTMPNMSLEEAIRIIQINERGRQGRRKAKEAREARSFGKELSHSQGEGGSSTTADPEAAAILIQKTFRGHLTRKKTRTMREEELTFIGMKPVVRSKENDPIEKADATRARRKLIQNQNQLEYQQAVINARKTILDQEGPDIKEKQQDEIRKHFLAHKEQIGKFPAFPSDEEGGSAKMLNPLLPPPVQTNSPSVRKKPSAASPAKPPPSVSKSSSKSSSLSRPAGSLSKSASLSKPISAKPAANPSSKSKFKATVKTPGKKEPDSSIPFRPVIPPSAFLADLHQATKKYLSLWAERDEESNFAQKHEMDLVRELLRPQVEEEIRKQVDAVLREELESLKASVEKEKEGKKKGKKKKGAKTSPNTITAKPKKAKEKKGKKKKRKALKDPTADRSIQSLYAELVSMKIIVPCPPISMNDFVAVYNIDKHNQIYSLQATLFGEIQAVMNLCILPLGASQQMSGGLAFPMSPRTLLLVAPPSHGKSTLCHIIANETGSLLLNLHPANLINASTARSMQLVLHMVFKVAKAMAPAVIFIDDVEKVFMKAKKKKKDGSNSPQSNTEGEENKKGVAEVAIMMRKELLAQINMLQPGDRVLVIGMTSNPNTATIGGGSMSFDRHLLLTQPDYTTRVVMWSKFVADAGRELAKGEASILARLTEGLPAGYIQSAVADVIKGSQVTDKKALQSLDFVPHLARMPTLKDVQVDMNSLLQWYSARPVRHITILPPPTPDIRERKTTPKPAARKK